MTSRRADADRGAVLILVAICLTVLVTATAFTVDLGRISTTRRELQATADVMALDLARLIDGRTASEIEGDPAWAQAIAASAARNEFAGAAIGIVGSGDPTENGVDVGAYDPTADAFAPSAPGDVPTAVQVRLGDTVSFYFAPGDQSTTRSAVAQIGGEDVAGFSIGSFGAALSAEDAGLLNALLVPILGSPADLDVLSYQGLADASIGVGELAAELGLLDPDDVFTTEVGAAEFIAAAADILRRNGDTANANLLDSLLTAEVAALPPFNIADLVSAEGGSESAALASSIDVLSLVTGAAFLSQCTDPDDLNTCSGLAIPELGAALPGVNVAADLRIIQAPVSHFGPVGSGTSTNQVGVGLEVDLFDPLGPCVPTLANLFCVIGGLGGLLVGFVGAYLTLDVDLRLAEGVGVIDAIGCDDPAVLGLDVATQTGLYRFTVDVTIDFRNNGLLGALLGSMTLTFASNLTDVRDLASFLVPPDVFGETVRETGGGSIGLAPLSLTVNDPAGVLGLVGGLLGLAGPVVLDLVINPVLETLDLLVLGPLTDLLGVNVVGADIVPLAIDCGAGGLSLVD